MSKTKKQTAVIGAGWFGKAHIRNYATISDLVAVCDLNLKAAKDAAQPYNAHAYADVDTMLKEEKLDAVSIVTPPSAIPSLAKKCAEKGINVLMEKPMGLAYNAVAELSKYPVRIQPGFIELYNPVMTELKTKYLSKIGEILNISSKRIGLYPRRDWGMGVVLDLTIHDVYLHQDLLGEVKGIKSMIRYFHDKKFEDAAYVLLDFGESKSLIESNWITPSKYRKMFISGSEGSIEVDFIGQYISIFEGKDLKGPQPEIWETKVNQLSPKEPLKEELLDFLQGDKPRVDLNRGLKALKVVLDVLNLSK